MARRVSKPNWDKTPIPSMIGRYGKDQKGGTFPKHECGAQKPDGSTCALPAGYRTQHPGYGSCGMHWGGTEHASVVAALQQAEDLMKFYGTLIEDASPETVLLQEVQRTAGHVAFLGTEIGKWEHSTEEFRAGPSDELLGWLRLYQAERAHLVRVAKAALDAGVQERQVSLAENIGLRVADTVDRILASLALSKEQQRIVPLVVPRELRQLTAMRTDLEEHETRE